MEKYRAKMLGKTSLWQAWRAELPLGDQIESAALQRLKLWAAFLDPDFKHSNHVARLALQLYDGLAANGYSPKPAAGNQREILRLAGLLHDVGRSKGEKGHHKATHRLVARLAPPLGVSRTALNLAAIVARYHRGALPQARQKAFGSLPSSERPDVLWLAAILRLANAFDAERDGRVQRLEVCPQITGKLNGSVVLVAEGYSARDRAAEGIAAARHLLETVCRRAVLVKAAPMKPPAARQRQRQNAVQRAIPGGN